MIKKIRSILLIFFLGLSYNNYAKEETNQIKKKERTFFIYVGFNLINSAQAKWVADDGSGTANIEWELDSPLVKIEVEAIKRNVFGKFSIGYGSYWEFFKEAKTVKWTSSEIGNGFSPTSNQFGAVGYYLDGHYQVSKPLTLTAGIHVSWINYLSYGYNASDHGLGYQVGVRYRLSERFIIKSNYRNIKRDQAVHIKSASFTSEITKNELNIYLGYGF
tara:strand:- start:4060 stop:4713 length:654 start_codon:yes stop_codon:yes gene_type:complete